MAKKLLKLDKEYKSSSFERFDDNLSEVILQYLSLEAKLRFECVSHQFQRTVFAKHYSLKLSPKMEEMNLISIKKFLKKFPNLSEIQLTSKGITITRMIVEALMESDNSFKKIEINPTYCPKDIFSKVIASFGSGLVSLDMNGFSALKKFYLPISPALTQLSNIEELMVTRIPDLSIVYFNPRLKSLKISEIWDEDFPYFEFITEDNRNSLRHLRIDSIRLTDDLMDETSDNLFLTLISNLKNLIDLNIGSELKETHLRHLSLNCELIESLSFHHNFKDNIKFIGLLTSLTSFQRLKRLNITFFYDYNDFEEEINLLPLTTYHTFQGLTHLDFTFIPNFVMTINEKNLFGDRENYLPKLQSLRIDGLIIDCTEYLANILSRHSYLKRIELTTTEMSPKREIAAKIINNCKRNSIIDIQSITSCNY